MSNVQSRPSSTIPQFSPRPQSSSSSSSAAVQLNSPVVSAPIPVETIQIAVLGMGNSGKSSLVNNLQGDFSGRSRPTNGFRPITLQLDARTKVRFHDLGGGLKIRDIWDQYYHDVHAVVYVIDAVNAANPLSLEQEVALFTSTLTNACLCDKPLLVLANKQDIQGALAASVLEKHLGNVVNKPLCRVVGTTAGIVPEGEEGCLDPNWESALEWLLKCIQDNFVELNSRVVADTVKRTKEEALKRIGRERKVLKNKIACAFPHLVKPEFLPADTRGPEDVFSKDEGESFLAGEIGVDVADMPSLALEVSAAVGYQRLALQIIGALNAPISKKKVPMAWTDIMDLIMDLRIELGLS